MAWSTATCWKSCTSSKTAELKSRYWKMSSITTFNWLLPNTEHQPHSANSLCNWLTHRKRASWCQSSIECHCYVTAGHKGECWKQWVYYRNWWDNSGDSLWVRWVAFLGSIVDSALGFWLCLCLLAGSWRTGILESPWVTRVHSSSGIWMWEVRQEVSISRRGTQVSILS